MSNPEQYALHVDEDSVTIRAATSRGAFYATQSLRQLLPPQIESPTVVESVDWSINAVQIDDMPKYGYRGMHLDVSRHFFPVEFVKCYLDWMALHKLNTFHWHLTDDQGWRIEIKKYPRLTEVGAWRRETVVGHTLSRDARGDSQSYGGFYTQEEIRDVVAYAASRHITILPEIDMPGHASALLAAYPEFGCRTGEFEVASHFGIFEDVLCPSEKTLAMIADVLEEVADLFPGPFIHIGGDEALMNQWQENAECQAIMRKNNLQNEEQLQSYFVRRVDAIVRKLGKQSIGWDDILDGGLDDKITVIAWRGMEKAAAAARAGHDVILSPGVFYFDFFQSRSVDEPLAIHGLSTLQDAYTFDMELQELDTGDRNRVLGAQGTLWTEYITTPEKAEYVRAGRTDLESERCQTVGGFCRPT
jgi:hexosaminidase